MVVVAFFLLLLKLYFCHCSSVVVAYFAGVVSIVVVVAIGHASVVMIDRAFHTAADAGVGVIGGPEISTTFVKQRTARNANWKTVAKTTR